MGAHSIDRFFSLRMHLIPIFNSGMLCSGTDAFTQNWKNENNWWIPPPRFTAIVRRTYIKHNKDFQVALYTTIVPQLNSCLKFEWILRGEGGKD